MSADSSGIRAELDSLQFLDRLVSFPTSLLEAIDARVDPLEEHRRRGRETGTESEEYDALSR